MEEWKEDPVPEMEFTNTGTRNKELLHQQVDGSGGGSGSGIGSEIGSGGYHQPASVMSEIELTRQPSVFSLTFDEFQSSHGNHIGKDFGSMNIEELLKNIWAAEESGLPDPATCSGLQTQISLKLPRTISLKTVDEVWRDFFPREENSGGGGVAVGEDEHGSATGREDDSGTILGKMTLEQFLERAGVIREEIPSRETENSSVAINNVDLRPTINTTNTGLSLGFPSAITLPPNVIPRPVDQDTIFFPTTASVQVVGGVGDPMMMNNGGRLVESDVAGYVAPSSSPGLPYVYDRGTFGKKTGGTGVEKAVERRQKRMIRNRESAARSRARKQAYTTELEAEVKNLKEQNQELQRKHDFLEAEKNQAWEIVRQHQKKPPPPQSPCM